MLFAKYASEFFDIFLPSLVWRIETLTVAGFATIPSMEPGIFEFIHLFNLYYGKYYIPLIFVVINTIIVWQNRKRFCHHFVRRYPRFLLLYIASFFLELGFLLNPFIPYPPDRFVNLSFIIFAQIPLLGYSLYIVLLRKGYATGLGATILILGFLWTLGFFQLFQFPVYRRNLGSYSTKRSGRSSMADRVKSSIPVYYIFRRKRRLHFLRKHFRSFCEVRVNPCRP
ncbi:hypothetical protein [Methanosarcina horonobensis]|uniref:hypothetical protein n=1 Tax=Methanosarcina horonobensis TaxID=418008 RepID=UPI000A9F53BE|nr:hypothetical protein [Methanosarcina horonobensis]